MSKAKAIEQLEHIRMLCGLELVDGNPGNQLAMECRMAATKAVRALGSEHDELGVAAAEPSAGPSAVSPAQTPEDAAAVPNAGMMTCKSCGNPIEHNGKHWMHVGISRRHPAAPNMPVPEARRTPSWEKPVLGYFRKGGTKWMLVDVDGNSLTGYDIAPGGGVHTLHIARESVDAFVLINKD